jgi:radical SAM protein with 4Fe4S-binding SPASM domain
VSDSLRALRLLAAERSTPLSMHLELTYRCNARCGHCLQDRGAAAGELSLAEWVEVLEQGRRLGVLFVSLSGGEAMLSPHFWGVAEAARRLGYALRIYTNGLGLDRPTVRRIAGLSPFAVEVSIFSLDPARHDAALGVPGSLRRTIRGLLALKRAGVATVLKCPLLAGTAADHGEIRKLAERLGSGVVFDPAIFTATDGRSGPTRCRGDDQVLEEYFADPATRRYARPGARPAPGAAPCGMARTFVVVGPSGLVHPCAAMPMSDGNVRQTPLDVLWVTSPLMQRLRSRTVGSLPECGDCPRSGYCNRCSALALLEDGDLDGPSSRACTIAEIRERAWGLPPPPNAPVPARKSLRVLG